MECSKIIKFKWGVFVTKDGEKILSIAEKNEFIFSQSQNIKNYIFDNSFNDKHINEVLNLSLYT